MLLTAIDAILSLCRTARSIRMTTCQELRQEDPELEEVTAL
jgi:hypothetical protein